MGAGFWVLGLELVRREDVGGTAFDLEGADRGDGGGANGEGEKRKES